MGPLGSKFFFICMVSGLFWMLSCRDTSPSSGNAVLATFSGGEIDKETFQSWCAYKKIRQPAELEPILRELALTLYASHWFLNSEKVPDRETVFGLELLEDRLLAAELRRHHDQSVQISAESVDAYLRAHDADRRQPPKVRLRNLFKKCPVEAGPQQRAAVREQMGRIRERLVQGADFGELAQRESESETRFRGGRMGMIKPGDLPLELEKVVFQLKKGEISPILEGPGGFTLLKCDDRVPTQTLSMAEARQRVRQRLLKQERHLRWKSLSETLIQQARVEYDLTVLTSDNPPAEAVVARFGDEVLTYAAWILLNDRRAAISEPSERGDFLVKTVLEPHVLPKLRANHARLLGLDNSAAFRQRLRWRRIEFLAAQARRHIALRNLKIPGDAELHAYIGAHPDRFVIPRAWRLAVIRMPFGDRQPARKMAFAQNILGQIRAGALSFAEAARAHSQFPRADGDGVLGWLTQRQLAKLGPTIFQTARNMTPGTVSDLVQQDKAVWILNLKDIREAKPMEPRESLLVAQRRLRAEQLRIQQEKAKETLMKGLDFELKSRRFFP